jgi:hypothetical protein
MMLLYLVRLRESGGESEETEESTGESEERGGASSIVS